MMWKRIADEDSDPTNNQFRRQIVRVTSSTPCTPSCFSSDWRFFLHNIKSRSSTSLQFIKDNVSKALAALKKDSSEVKDSESYLADLEKCLAMLERLGNGNGASAPELHKAKQLAVRVLDSTRDPCPPGFSNAQEADTALEPARQRMGFQRMYQMSKDQFKALEQSKEEYMAAALRLKEELERKAAEEEEEEEEDDDDEDEEDKAKDNDEDQEDKAKDNETSASEPKEVAAVEAPTDEAQDDTPSEEAVQDSIPEETTENDETKEAETKSDADDDDDEVEVKKRGPGRPRKSDAAAASSGKTEDDGPTVEEDDKSDILSDDPYYSTVENTTRHPTVSDAHRHLPTEPVDGMPDGWVLRRIPRRNPSDKRSDSYFYSPKLGLKFRARTDALRFIDILESVNGDESAAIMKYHGRSTSKPEKVQVANKASGRSTPVNDEADESKVEYDFCEDVPSAPDLIRRCLADRKSVV